MKSILIIGKNSYIGKSFFHYMSKKSEYKIEMITVRDSVWQRDNWGRFDTVINFTGIAHRTSFKVNEDEYYKVNNELAFELAKKTKEDNVKHFIQMSTMSVFGNDNNFITKTTLEKPISVYGKSKLAADQAIKELENDTFNISIIRPPMVYGKDSPGNYKKLSKLANIFPIFPKINNKKSMIYIENLCEFLFVCIKDNLYGTFYPQNSEYICTSKMYKYIRKSNCKNTYFIKMDFLISNLSKYVGLVDKIFGNLAYSKNMSNLELNYNIIEFEESIKLSESRKGK